MAGTGGHIWGGNVAETIGVRELKTQASRILRHVRDDQAEYVVTLHGKPVAVLRPFTPADVADARQAVIEKELADLRALADEMASEWTSDKTAVELVSEQRRG